MVTLFRFGPAWDTFGCVSQFVLKVETYLRMADIEFETKSLGLAFAETAPKGKLPYIDTMEPRLQTQVSSLTT